MADLRLSTKSQVIRMIDDGITSQEAANQFNVTGENVMSMMQTLEKVESLEKSHTNRNNLSLGDKLRILHPMSM